MILVSVFALKNTVNTHICQINRGCGKYLKVGIILEKLLWGGKRFFQFQISKSF